jgi:hypothetical protein
MKEKWKREQVRKCKEKKTGVKRNRRTKDREEKQGAERY